MRKECHYAKLRVQIYRKPHRGNGHYALAAESSKLLYDSLEPIVQNEGDISISAGDCLNFREYFEQEFEATAIMQKELYRQGYLDCVKLLVTLGLLAGKT